MAMQVLLIQVAMGALQLWSMATDPAHPCRRSAVAGSQAPLLMIMTVMA